MGWGGQIGNSWGLLPASRIRSDALLPRGMILRAEKRLIFTEGEVMIERYNQRLIVAKTSSTLAVISCYETLCSDPTHCWAKLLSCRPIRGQFMVNTSVSLGSYGSRVNATVLRARSTATLVMPSAAGLINPSKS